MPISVHMFRRMSPRRPRSSLYGEIAAAIRRQVLDGTLRPGDRLPSEKDMRHEFGVGQDTVRDALAVLRNEGLIVSEQGRRHQIRVPPRRQLVWLRPGERASARMPTPEERAEHDIAIGIPVLVVGAAVYPADRFELSTRRPRAGNQLQR
jgi:DNA-binding GntR family transcriptional regulator